MGVGGLFLVTDEGRTVVDCPGIVLIDEIEALYMSTLYKLKYLA